MNDNPYYTIDEKKALLQLARETIENVVNHIEKEYPKTENPKFLEKRGVFVTLRKKEKLRGCIGYPLPTKSVVEAVIDNAISSAVHDPRFKPVTAKELKDIAIEISILTVPRKVKDHTEVVVGRDGIIISKGFMRGLLLPQVPLEQGWNLEEYISYGCLKAGLPNDEWKRSVEIETFEGIVFGEIEIE
ncbi:MAG: AmmeMemoRadiSam system protein A [Candidatus Omnitrophota bacterium]